MEDAVVDARWLEPPEPLNLTLDGLARLRSGQRLRLLIHRLPYLLYPMLQEWGYACDTTEAAEGCFEVTIWRSSADDIPERGGQ